MSNVSIDDHDQTFVHDDILRLNHFVPMLIFWIIEYKELCILTVSYELTPMNGLILKLCIIITIIC